MKYTDDLMKMNGTSLQGYVTATRDELQRAFGPPNGPPDVYRITSEWVLEDEDGVIVTLYDWKRGVDFPPALDEPYNWRIGGFGDEAVRALHRAGFTNARSGLY